MPRLVTCKCGYAFGGIDRPDTTTRCPKCHKKIFLPARDEKEDHSEFHRGIGGPPKGSGKVFVFGPGKDKK